jgi:hypothetical protein
MRMTPQQWSGLAMGLLIGAVYGTIQRRCMGEGPRPDGAGRAFLGAVMRLVALVVTVFVLLRVTEADRILLVVGVMASYGIMFGLTMASVIRRKNGKP